MNLFRRKEKLVLAERLELVSLHIPKTAGTSFRDILKQVYGAEAVLRVDNPLEKDLLKFDEIKVATDQFPTGTKVIHGHFNINRLRNYLPVPEKVHRITWLRHPVDRVISNYHYLIKRLAEEHAAVGLQLNFLHKIQRNLLEFAQAEVNRNVQAKFLEGTALSEFSFVGIQEHFAADVSDLAKALCWEEDIRIPEHNVTNAGPVVSEEERAEIARLNAADMALYEEGLRLRAGRRGEPKIELISIHIPKTAGTAFYQSLKRVYGPDVSYSFRKKDYLRSVSNYGSLLGGLTGNIRVIHGHVRYEEVADVHLAQLPKLVCWLRDPVERVISNYLFFRSNLTGPIRNLELYENNKHRKNEELLTYARRDDCRNKIADFIGGVPLEAFFFIGFQENFAEDLQQLAELLGWPEAYNTQLNVGNYQAKQQLGISAEVRAEIARLNAVDVALYAKAREMRKKG